MLSRMENSREFSETSWQVTAQFRCNEHTGHREILELWILDSVLLDELLQPQGNVQQGGVQDVQIHHPAWECCTWLKGLEFLRALGNPNSLTVTVPPLDFIRDQIPAILFLSS